MTPITPSMTPVVPETIKVRFEKFTHIEHAWNTIRATAEKVACVIKDFLANAIHHIHQAFSEAYNAVQSRLYAKHPEQDLPTIHNTGLLPPPPMNNEQVTEPLTVSEEPADLEAKIEQPEFSTDIIELDDADAEDVDDVNDNSPVVESEKPWISVSNAVMLSALLAIVGAGVWYGASTLLLTTQPVNQQI